MCARHEPAPRQSTARLAINACGARRRTRCWERCLWLGPRSCGLVFPLGLVPRINRVRQGIEKAVFTGKGDKETVVRLYNKFVAKIGNAIANAGEELDGDYDGEYNSAGEREGRGTLKRADGAVYQGEFKAGKMEGVGTLLLASGAQYTGEFKAGVKEGHGVYSYTNGGVFKDPPLCLEPWALETP